MFLLHRVRWTAFLRFGVPRNPTQSFVGDLHYCQGLVHIDAVQFDNPSVCIKFDSDPEKAAEQRKRTFADAAKNRYLLAFAHVSFPGVVGGQRILHGEVPGGGPDRDHGPQ